MVKPVSGFSKKTKTAKISWLAETYLQNDPQAIRTLSQYWNEDTDLQDLHDDFIENTITNYYLPFGVAPNFLINGKLYALPMVIEESSVVAAASNAAKFWLERGGFKSSVEGTLKNGQVHVNFYGKKETLEDFFTYVKPQLLKTITPIERKMKKRGGGLLEISLEDTTNALEGYYQLHCTFETRDAMGANFINSCLEAIAETFEEAASTYTPFSSEGYYPEVVLSILSNYVPECLVRASVSCPVQTLDQKDISGEEFAELFTRAVQIAQVEPRRAVTHNKGIMNGIDAVVLATGNDFRAVEAGVHAFASRNGRYSSLTEATVTDGIFNFSIAVPLAVGTVGGLTSLHPLVRIALDILQRPSADELMEILAVAGLAQNFAAIRSLITTGIQKGHMKMHLKNILNQLGASETEKDKAIAFFNEHQISHSAVASYIEKLRTR